MGLGNGGDQRAQEANYQAGGNVGAVFVEEVGPFEYVGLGIGNTLLEVLRFGFGE